jgi:hypothetical protein
MFSGKLAMCSSRIIISLCMPGGKRSSDVCMYVCICYVPRGKRACDACVSVYMYVCICYVPQKVHALWQACYVCVYVCMYVYVMCSSRIIISLCMPGGKRSSDVCVCVCMYVCVCYVHDHFVVYAWGKALIWCMCVYVCMYVYAMCMIIL